MDAGCRRYGVVYLSVVEAVGGDWCEGGCSTVAAGRGGKLEGAATVEFEFDVYHPRVGGVAQGGRSGAVGVKGKLLEGRVVCGTWGFGWVGI